MNAQQIIAAEMQRERKRTHQPNRVLLALLSFGIKESDLAQQLGCNVSMITVWKTGQRSVAEHWMPHLYDLLGTFIDSKPATIALLKQQGQWDSQLRKIVSDRFRRAQKVYDARPEQYRTDGEAA